MIRVPPSLVCASLLALVPACGSDPAPAPRSAGSPSRAAAAPPAAAAMATQPRGDTASPTTGSVHIDDRIIQACGDLPTPHFAFDSASIAGDAATTLHAVARCFVEGPLRGREARLVGHADPRGPTDYNLVLGQERAQSVAGFLARSGLDSARVTTMSKGEFAATGTDEEGWAHDRRVEILLAD
jgi:peptidoglycan-associated lipoprotein